MIGITEKRSLLKCALDSGDIEFQRTVLAFVADEKVARGGPNPLLMEVVQNRVKGPRAVQHLEKVIKQIGQGRETDVAENYPLLKAIAMGRSGARELDISPLISAQVLPLMARHRVRLSGQDRAIFGRAHEVAQSKIQSTTGPSQAEHRGRFEVKDPGRGAPAPRPGALPAGQKVYPRTTGPARSRVRDPRQHVSPRRVVQAPSPHRQQLHQERMDVRQRHLNAPDVQDDWGDPWQRSAPRRAPLVPPGMLRRPGVGMGPPPMLRRAMLEYAFKRNEPGLNRVVLAYCQSQEETSTLTKYAMDNRDVEFARFLLSTVD